VKAADESGDWKAMQAEIDDVVKKACASLFGKEGLDASDLISKRGHLFFDSIGKQLLEYRKTGSSTVGKK
jgi:hypothetical protein